jgi:hypothetical protein
MSEPYSKRESAQFTDALRSTGLVTNSLDRMLQSSVEQTLEACFPGDIQQGITPLLKPHSTLAPTRVMQFTCDRLLVYQSNYWRFFGYPRLYNSAVSIRSFCCFDSYLGFLEAVISCGLLEKSRSAIRLHQISKRGGQGRRFTMDLRCSTCLPFLSFPAIHVILPSLS